MRRAGAVRGAMLLAALLLTGAAAVPWPPPSSPSGPRPTPNLTASPVVPAMSLMVQVSTTASRAESDSSVLEELHASLESIRTRHRNPQAAGYIRNLVLTDIDSVAAPARLATNVLDVIAPYLPGGSRPAFDRVFVGTVGSPSCEFTAGIPAVLAGCARSTAWSPYVEGISTQAVRDWSTATSETLTRAFVQRYPRVHVDWYVSWEGFLPTLMRDEVVRGVSAASIRQSYIAYVTALTGALGKVAAGRDFLWSPALDQPLAQLRVDGALPAFLTNVGAFFANLRSSMAKDRSTVSSRLWLDAQDGLSRPCLLIGGAYNNTVATRVEWYRLLAAYRSAWMPEVQLNAELFTSPNCPAFGTRSAVLSRLSSYAVAGVSVGPSFDLFSWATIVGSTTDGASAYLGPPPRRRVSD